MELRWPDGTSDDPTEEQIRALVPTAQHVVLGKARLTYIQCGQRTLPPWGITLEYQDGSMGRHYRGAMGPYDAETVVAVMIKYLHDDPSWHSDIGDWEHLDMLKLLRMEARWRRQNEFRARLAASRAHVASNRMPPGGRIFRPAPLSSTVGPERAPSADAGLIGPSADECRRQASLYGARETVRRAMAAVRRRLAARSRRRRSGA